MRRAPRPPGSERGFALLIVLWTLVLITLLVSHLGAAGRGETQLARNLRDAAATEAAADGAVYEAISRLLDGSSRHWIADRRPYELRLPQAVAVVRIEDENGKIDPNASSVELLTALLHAAGADTRTAATVAGALIDWTFPSAQADRITAAYRAAGLGYRPPAAQFQTLGEIGLVLGMTPDLLASLLPHLTIFHEGDPDPRVADPVVATAIHDETGAQIAPPADDRAGHVVTIHVAATGLGGSRFTRDATVRLGATPTQQNPNGLYRILAWD